METLMKRKVCQSIKKILTPKQTCLSVEFMNGLRMTRDIVSMYCDVTDVPISKELLTSVRQSNKKYSKRIEAEKEEKLRDKKATEGKKATDGKQAKGREKQLVKKHQDGFTFQLQKLGTQQQLRYLQRISFLNENANYHL
ncbi:hypothetical protein DPMN_047788 [Dreissena polymorpha]|uniref:Uncharacterized protein n=1 Tax=Dreissena polymorpha TaxID=45954 RepID=A0A9D4HZH1_DREPO|nr:hypothetical protein DPMN_047788 [Dreissena polymorpha]